MTIAVRIKCMLAIAPAWGHLQHCTQSIFKPLYCCINCFSVTAMDLSMAIDNMPFGYGFLTICHTYTQGFHWTKSVFSLNNISCNISCKACGRPEMHHYPNLSKSRCKSVLRNCAEVLKWLHHRQTELV